MKIGIAIRHDMGGIIIKDSEALVNFLANFKNIDFVELHCNYPMPLNLMNDIQKLKDFISSRNISVGLNFPIKWHDRWKLRKGFEEVRSIILEFANEIHALYVNIHPESLAYFTQKEAKDDIMKELLALKNSSKSNITVMNGYSVFQTPEDLNFFAKGGIRICLDICHIFQGGMEYTKFREQLHEFKDKIFLYRLSDFGERPHMQLGFGKIPYSKLMRNIREFDPHIVVDTLLSVENELIFRNPNVAIEKSVEYLKSL